MFRRAAIWAVVGIVIILVAGVALLLRDDPDAPGPPMPSQMTHARTARRARRATTATTQASPRPDLKPGDVVRIVVEALANNDEDDEGIRVTWAFASPGNKRMTGPLERFAPMVKSPAYRPLLYPNETDYRPIAVAGDQAEQLVVLTNDDGGRAYYVFRLSRQGDGPFKDCWMTDGVIPVAPTERGKPDQKERPKPKPQPKDESLPI